MESTFKNLSPYSKTFRLSVIVEMAVALVFLVLSFCGVFDFFVPLGIALGSGFSAGSYALLSIVDESNENDKKLKLTVAILFIRLFLLIGLVALEVILQIFVEITLFNPFGFIGSYFVTSLIYGIVYLKEKKC